jgi:glycosyltransferase involved in cell wall biosynthesis
VEDYILTMPGGAPLRVLRLCSVFEPPASALDGQAAGLDPIGGMQDHTAALTRVLERRDVAQVVLTTRQPTAPAMERLAAGATVVRVGLPVRRPRQLYALPAAVLAPLLARRADLVHAHLGEDLAILPLAVLAAGRRPLVVTVHCSMAHTLKVTGPRSLALKTLGGPIEQWGEHRATATLALTARLTDALAAELGPDRVHLVRRGIDRRAFQDPGPDPFPDLTGRPRVVYLGRLVRGKGVETLVRAAARLRAPGVQVVLVGDGPDRAAVEQLARRLGVADRVRVTGFVPHERVPAVLASADLLVLPSLYEELGTVLIEAMQLGLPIVASRVGGIPEVLGNGERGLLVPPGDAAALAEAVDAVLADPALARRLGAAGLRHAPEYDWDRVGAQIHELYSQLVDGRPQQRADSAGSGGLADRLNRRLWPA